MKTLFQILFLILFVGCAETPYVDKHSIYVNVIYADANTIAAEYEKRFPGSLNDIVFSNVFGLSRIEKKIALGFYDWNKNELWCLGDNSDHAFTVCGHELYHRIKGSWHK